MMNYKKSPKTQAMDLADKFFSLWFRANEADENGMCQCCTCLKIIEWRPADQSTHFGHFIPRRFFKTRYDPVNGDIQCKECNEDGEGMQEFMREHLLRKHGEEAILTLEADHRSITPHTIFDLIEIAEKYQALFYEVAKQKGFKLEYKNTKDMTKTFCDGCETEITHGIKKLTLQARNYTVCPDCYRQIMEAAVEKLKSIKK